MTSSTFPLNIGQFIQTISAVPTATLPDSNKLHLDRIEDEIQNVKNRIQFNINSKWSNFDQQWKSGYTLLHQSVQQEQELKQIETNLADPHHGLIPRLFESLKTHQGLAAQQTDLALVLDTTRSLAQAFQSLSNLSESLKEGSLDTAVARLPAYKATIHRQISHTEKSWLAKRAVNGIKELEEDLKQRLIDAVRQGLVIHRSSVNNSTVIEIEEYVNTNKHGSASMMLWSSAMVALQGLSGGGEDQLKKLATQIIEHISTPLIVSANIETTPRHLTRSPRATKDSRIQLHLKPHPEGQYDVYDSLKCLLSTLIETLFTKHILLRTFVPIFIPSIQSCLIANYLYPHLPSTPHHEPHLSELPGLLLRTRDFENWLCGNGWLAPEDKDSFVLTNWCDQVDRHFAKKMTTRILEAARQEILMTQWDNDTVDWLVVHPVEPPARVSNASPFVSSDSDAVFDKLSRAGSVRVNGPFEPSAPILSMNDDRQAIGGTSTLRQSNTTFKSLFNFGVGDPQESKQCNQTDAQVGGSPAIPNTEEATSFRSLFSFGESEDLSTQPITRSNPSSSALTEKTTSSPELIDRISELSSPRSVGSGQQLGPPSSKLDHQEMTIKVDEDVDWDMGVDSAAQETPAVIKAAVLLDSLPNTLPALQMSDAHAEEVEEDAWGLGDEENDDLGMDEDVRTPVVSEKTRGRQLVQPSQAIAISTPELRSAESESETGEDEEPDPDGWGFEEAEPDAESKEVLRLRGGMDSASQSEDEEDGWAWHDDPATNDTHREACSLSPSGDQIRSSVLQSSEFPDKTFSKHVPTEPMATMERLKISKVAQRLMNFARTLVADATVLANPDFTESSSFLLLLTLLRISLVSPGFMDRFSVDSLSSSSPHLIRTALDLFDLFRVLMPLHHSNLLNTVPSLTAQFTNDCDWLAKEVKTLNWLSADEDADKVAQNLMSLAKKTRETQLAAQLAIIAEYLDEAEGFTATSDQQKFYQCEKACKQVIHTLQQLSHVWEPVMLSLEYAQSMGHLVEAILRRTLEEIEAQTDISETESKQLNILCKSLHQLSDLFGDGAKQSVIAKHVPSWFKFCFLSELLEASMADIMWMHQEGLLLEFSTHEIVGLIRALFSDSSLRAKNIDIITSSSRRGE